MNWLMVLTGVLIVFAVGCATIQKNVEDPKRTIGPCYGSSRVFPGTFGCYYDVDGDKKPDIVLVYKYTDGGLVLIDSFLMDELHGK